MEIINLQEYKERSAEGVTNVVETHTSVEGQTTVTDVIKIITEANLDEIAVIGVKRQDDGLSSLHYLQSDMSVEDLLYLVEKRKFALMYDDYRGVEDYEG